MIEFDEQLLQHMCNKYNIKYKVFPQTGVLLLDSGLDEWQVKYVGNKDRPYCLYHKNKIRQTNKYHVQRWLRKLSHVIDSIARHKGVLINLYTSQNTYNKYKKYSKRNNKNTNINKKKGKTYC